jgi:periplasmic protein TonB
MNASSSSGMRLSPAWLRPAAALLISVVHAAVLWGLPAAAPSLTTGVPIVEVTIIPEGDPARELAPVGSAEAPTDVAAASQPPPNAMDEPAPPLENSPVAIILPPPDAPPEPRIEVESASIPPVEERPAEREASPSPDTTPPQAAVPQPVINTVATPAAPEAPLPTAAPVEPQRPAPRREMRSAERPEVEQRRTEQRRRQAEREERANADVRRAERQRQDESRRDASRREQVRQARAQPSDGIQQARTPSAAQTGAPAPETARGVSQGGGGARQQVGNASSGAYAAQVRAILQSRANGLGLEDVEGTVGISFQVGPSGRLTSHGISRPSGNFAIDRAIRSMLASVAFPPPPGGSFSGNVVVRVR